MQINCSYDTKTKAFAATADGKAIADLDEMNVYRNSSESGEAKYRLRMSTAKRNDEHGTVHMGHTYASEGVKESAELPGLFEAEEKVLAQIESFFGE